MLYFHNFGTQFLLTSGSCPFLVIRVEALKMMRLTLTYTYPVDLIGIVTGYV